MSFEVRVRDADQMRAVGRVLGASLSAGDLVLLTGPLGAGKTTLVQGVGEGLQVRGPIASPTFIIARTHPSLGSGPSLIHVDAYRLSSLDELDHLDLDDSLTDSVTVVEWGEGKAEVLAEDRLHLVIDRERGNFDLNAPEAGDRVVKISAHGARWDVEALAAIEREVGP